MRRPRRRSRLVGLAARMGLHRWPQSLGLLLAGAALGGPIVGLVVIHQSGARAIEESVRGEFGYAHGWKLQATSAAVSALEHLPDVTAVRVGDATVATSSARIDAPSWSIDNGKAPLGLLVAGRHATADGEATVSDHLAETLGVRPGSALTLHREDGDARVRVVGITRDPADRARDLVVDVRPRSAGVGEPTYWIVPKDTAAWVNTPGLAATSVGGTTGVRLESQPGALMAIGRAIPVVAVLTVLVMLTAVLGQLPGARADLGALQAAGLARRRSWRVVAIWVAVSVALGAAAGSAAATVLVRVFDDHVASAFGQRWTGIELPWLPPSLVVVLPLLIAFVPMRIAEAVFAAIRHHDRQVHAGRRPVVVAGVALGALGMVLVTLSLLAASDRAHLDHPEMVGLAGILGTVLGVRLGTDGVVGLGRGRASGELARRLAGGLTVGTGIALLVGSAAAGYAAWHTHNAYALSRVTVAPQVNGSYLAYEVPAAAAEQVLARYRAFGGTHAVVYELPDESRGSVRVTTPDTVQCVESGQPTGDQVDSCLQSRVSMMTDVALDSSLPPHEVLVQTDVQDDNGRVGIVRFGADNVTVTGTEVVSASAGKGLGGNLPGMLVSPDNPLAAKYGLAPSGLVELGLLDFGSLKARDAARIRGLVATLAPAAQVSDATTDTTQEQRLAISLLAALVGAVLALIIQLATCVSMVSGSRQVRRAVAATGLARLQRGAISVRVVGPTLVALVVSGTLVVSVAPRLGYHAEGGIGWTWLLPLAAPTVVVVVSGLMLLRAPRR